jgi:hypothetical protein
MRRVGTAHGRPGAVSVARKRRRQDNRRLGRFWMLGHESNHAPAGRATQPKTRNRQLSGSNQAQSFAGRNRRLRRLGRKSLKLRIAKSDDFAGSFVYNNLAGLFVRRFLHARQDRLPRFTSRRSRSSWHEFWKS